MKLKFNLKTMPKGTWWLGAFIGCQESEQYGFEIDLFKWAFLFRIIKKGSK